ncbi:hypothetical protein YIM_32175 [Amycolatopsis sp. YIM 10]|nr:hypothetical protein YIM_32175 [Amycolatopsis sp. YIM 10]
MTSQGAPRRREPRTLLEQLIWERNQTLAEFVEWAEEFARRHNEPGTLSERNLKRLMSGRRPDGTRLGRPRPATSRLLEQIFGFAMAELLRLPRATPGDNERELRARLASAQKIDSTTVELLQKQLDSIRRLDGRIGAANTHEEVIQKLNQIIQLMTYSLSPVVRQRLASLMSEFGTLAGWQALDLGSPLEAWQYYELARLAAYDSDELPFKVHAEAERSTMLLDFGKTNEAVLILENSLKRFGSSNSKLQAWLTASYGEALAFNGDHTRSLNAFDRASNILEKSTDTVPFVLLNAAHLERWRGHAVTQFSPQMAEDILKSSLSRLDDESRRAENSLRIDLAKCLVENGNQEEATTHVEIAAAMAVDIGSIRQERRIRSMGITHLN